MDNTSTAVQVTGTWAPSSASSGYLGTDYRYRVAGDGSSAVSWPFPATSAAATYEVFARWTSGPNRASNATYVVVHAAGSHARSASTSAPVAARGIAGHIQLHVRAPTRRQPVRQGRRRRRRRRRPLGPRSHRQLRQRAATPTSSRSALLRPDPLSHRPRRLLGLLPEARRGAHASAIRSAASSLFFGCQTQFFQRVAMQQCGNQGVGTLNLLEDGLLPYTRFNGSTLPRPGPGADRERRRCPATRTTRTKAIDFVRANAPETVDGEPVKFFSTFQTTVGLARRLSAGQRRRRAAAAVEPPAVGPADQQAGLRPEQPRVHLPALSARGDALRPRLPLHPGPAAGGLPQEPAHGRAPAGRPGRAGRRQSALQAAVPAAAPRATTFGDAFAAQAPRARPQPASPRPPPPAPPRLRAGRTRSRSAAPTTA